MEDHIWLAGVLETNGTFRIDQGKPTFSFGTANLQLAKRVEGIVPTKRRDAGLTTVLPGDWGQKDSYNLLRKSRGLPDWFVENIVPHLTTDRGQEVTSWAAQCEETGATYYKGGQYGNARV